MIRIAPLLALLVWTNASGAEGRKPGRRIEDADRACKADADCAVVQLECRCMYCAREGDFQAGVVAAANKGRLEKYAKLGRCSRAQQRACATAGACAMTGTSEARCRANLCVVEYAPRSGL